MINEQKLSELFAKLGARNPAKWAHSEATEKIPQLARFLVLRQAWKLIIAENDKDWIRQQANTDPAVPGGAIGPALKRLLAQGVAEEDLTTVVRVMQWRLLAAMCYLLDDPGNLEKEVSHVLWRLFQVNENEEPIAIIGGLHESVLETEPSGREMRG